MATDLRIQAGVPYSVRARIKGGVEVWPDPENREVRGAVAGGVDLSSYCTISEDGEDLLVTLSLTGAQTRQLPLDRRVYDILLSEKGTDDAKAVLALSGRILVKPIQSPAA